METVTCHIPRSQISQFLSKQGCQGRQIKSLPWPAHRDVPGAQSQLGGICWGSPDILIVNDTFVISLKQRLICLYDKGYI